MVNKEDKVLLDSQVFLESRVPMAAEDLLEEGDQMDHLECPDLRVPREELVLMVDLGLRDDPVLLDLLVTEGLQDFLDQQDLLAPEEPWVHKEREESQESRARKDLRAHLEWEDPPADLAQGEKGESKVSLESLELLALPEGLETRDHLAQLEQWDHLEDQVYLARLVKLEIEDLLETGVIEESQVLLVWLDHLV